MICVNPINIFWAFSQHKKYILYRINPIYIMTYGTNESIILTDSNSDSITYTLYGNGNLLFTGKAYKFPDSSVLEVDLTDIVHDCVAPVSLNTSTGFPTNPELKTVVEFEYSGTTSQTFSCRYWNRFDEQVPSGSYLFNDPAGLVVDPGSWIYPLCTGTAKLYKNSTLIGSYAAGSTKIDLNDFELSSGDTLTLTVGNQSIKYKVRCGGHYDLLYQNTKGAIDTLTCFGHCTMSSEAERYSMRTGFVYGPATLYQHNDKNYATKGTVSWNLNTGPLSDAGCVNIPEIILSNRCWLHDIQTGKLFAVNIRDTNIEQKIRKKNAGSMNYTITVNLARPVNVRN